MKLNSIYIHAFGGLKNLKIDLNDGFTLIYGKNEMGKTTIMNFIKMMFYGSGRASAHISKNLRQKYTPWDGTQPAGSIEFTHNGRNYRLEKEIKASNSTDKATLVDLDLGTRQSVPSDIGISFFGISASAFERSVFIGQLGFPEKDINAVGEINSKLSNIALTGEESHSFDEVNGRLSKAKLALMSKSGKAGEYDKGIKLLKELRDKFELCLLKNASAQEKLKQISESEKEIEALAKKAIELKGKINAEQDIRNGVKLKALLDSKSELDAINESLRLKDGSVADEIYLGKLRFCLNKLFSSKEKIKSKLNEISLLEKSISLGVNPPENATAENAENLKNEAEKLNFKLDEIDKNIDTFNKKAYELKSQAEAAKNKKKIVNPTFLTIGAVALVAAIVLLGIKMTAVGLGMGSLSLVLLILSFIIRPSDSRLFLELEQRISEINSNLADLNIRKSTALNEISVISIKLEAINAALSSTSKVIEEQKKLLEDSKNALSELKEQVKLEENSLLEQFSKYRSIENFAEAEVLLNEIESGTSKQKGIKQQISFILKDLNGISYDEAEQKLKLIENSDLTLTENFDELKEEYERLVSNINNRKTSIAAASVEIKSMLSDSDDLERLKSQISELKQKTDLQKEFCLCIDIAQNVLSESFAEVRRSYGSVLEKRAGEIFKGITGEKYSNMSISKSLEIAVEKTGDFGSHEIDYLSSGTADQAYLSLRLALTELMSGENQVLPVFLDDALTQYDDERVEKAVSFLKSYSKSAQVIMFTCHRSVFDIAKKYDVNLKEL